jgi:hypothetical protein
MLLSLPGPDPVGCPGGEASMRNRPINRKVNYASNVKINLPGIMGGHVFSLALNMHKFTKQSTAFAE